MSRRNVNHEQKHVLDLAVALEQYASELRELAARFDEHDIDEPMSVSHRYGVDAGLMALPRLIRDLRIKQDDFVVNRKREEQRNRTAPFVMPDLSATARKPARKRP
jgi:hypothetical protein